MKEPGPDAAAGAARAPAPAGLRACWDPLPRLHRVALVLTGLFALVLAVRGAALSLRPRGNDLTIYFEASRAVLAGRTPLDVEGAIYLPFYALATLPFALVPYPLGAALWALASLLSLVWCALACARLLARPGERAWPWLVWAPTALCLRPIDSCFANGQVNLMVFALVLLGITALARGRENRGAAFLGLAAALKLVPALYLVGLAARRRWGAALLGAGVALGLALLVPLPLRGVQGTRDDLTRWAQEVAGPFARGGAELSEAWPRAPGQSLSAMVHRLMTQDPERMADGRLPLVPPTTEDLDRARLVVRLASAGLLLVLFLPLLARPAAHGSVAWAREVALVTTTALLIAPLVRKAHLVWLLLPFAVVLRTVLDPATSRSERVWAGVTLALAGLLIAGTAPALVGRSEATYLLVYSALFWGVLALHLGLVPGVWRAAFRRPAR